MKNDQDWIKTYKRKFTLERLLILLYFLVPFILCFVFAFLGGPLTTHVDPDGTVVVDGNNPGLTITGFVFGIISFILFIYSFIAIIHTRTDISEYKGHTIMAYILNKKCMLIIDGEVTEKIRRMNYKDFVVLNGLTSTGIKVTCKIAGIKTNFLYDEPSIDHKIVIINNVKKGKKKKDDLTPIQKKLVEQAKTDALANIDPNKPEEAKKNIEVYNELDKLDE